MKTVGFYGHSSCAYRGEHSHIDILANNFGLDVINIGVRQGSEERILYELKKTKNLDLAIIFHSEPQYLFLPDCDRDIGLNHLGEHRAEYLFQNWNSKFYLEHHGRFLEKFKNPNTFMTAISAYKEYFYTPDLQMNRFLGSLSQIDQYCTVKSIPVIHVVIEKSIPEWFKFSSGIVDNEVMKIANSFSISRQEWFVNAINKEGNMLIAKRLTGLVEDLIPPSLTAVV